VQVAFSALKLLVWRQEEHPTCKNWVMRYWCFIKFRSVWPSWRWLTQVVLEKTLSLPPVGIIWAMMTSWKIRGKIIRTVLCCVVYDSCASRHVQVSSTRYLMSSLLILVFWCKSSTRSINPGEPGLAATSSVLFFSYVLQQNLCKQVATGFMDQMSVLSTNQQCQSTERNSKHWP